MAKRIKPVHPGEILREDFMEPHGLSVNRLALDLRGAGHAHCRGCARASRNYA